MAYLFEKVVNVEIDGSVVDRYLTTGRHLIQNLRCSGCGVVFGWTYIKAYEMDQKYKENKFILELAYLKTIDNSTLNLPSCILLTPRNISRINYFR